MEKIKDFEKFICDAITHSLEKPYARVADIFYYALKDQGIEYSDGRLGKAKLNVSSDGNESLGKNDVLKKSDIDKMICQFINSRDNFKDKRVADIYRQGIIDTLEKIKEVGGL